MINKALYPMYLKNIPVLRTKRLQYQRRFKEKLCDVTCCMTAKSENYFRIQQVLYFVSLRFVFVHFFF